MIHFIAALLAFAVMVAASILGVDWLTLGYGLNPWIAFPIAFIASWASYNQVSTGVCQYREQVITQQFEELRLQRIARM